MIYTKSCCTHTDREQQGRSKDWGVSISNSYQTRISYFWQVLPVCRKDYKRIQGGERGSGKVVRQSKRREREREIQWEWLQSKTARKQLHSCHKFQREEEIVGCNTQELHWKHCPWSYLVTISFSLLEACPPLLIGWMAVDRKYSLWFLKYWSTNGRTTWWWGDNKWVNVLVCFNVFSRRRQMLHFGV